MVEPIDFQSMIDLKRSVDKDKKSIKQKPGTKSSFASALDQQKELSESLVQNTHATDMYVIHDDEHSEQQQKKQNQKQKPKDEDTVPKEQHLVDTTAGEEPTEDEQEHSVDIKA